MEAPQTAPRVLRQPLCALLAAPPGPGRDGLLASMAATGIDLDLHTVDDLPRAFDALGRRVFDCALIDANLGFGDGAALMEGLNAVGADTPLVMITDGDPGDNGRALMEAGVADCVDRAELSGERLWRCVFNVVRAHRVAQRLARTERNFIARAALDGVTRLPNREQFFAHVAATIGEAEHGRSPIALLVFDINGFHDFNRTMGHGAGDRLLRLAAERMAQGLRGACFLARLGNDEFAVVLRRGAAGAQALAAARHLLQALSEPFVSDGREISLSASAGIALFPAHGDTADTLLRNAEFALRAAKRGGDGIVVYSADDKAADPEQAMLAQDLRLAIERKELELAYQPKIDMKRRCVVGVEALLRWRHTQRGMIYPDTFIPLAEQTGMIDPITLWVLDTALTQSRAWRRAGRDLTVSVNLSPLTLRDVAFPDSVAALLRKRQADPGLLVLEITESTIILDAARARTIVKRLAAMGVRVAIDDFGTGYSSLATIRELPVDEIKVDKSFVMNMRQNPDDAAIVRTIVELGHNLGLRIVAEGVEDAETFEMLASLGCTEAQGYYMCRPTDNLSLETWLRESPWGVPEDIEGAEQTTVKPRRTRAGRASIRRRTRARVKSRDEI
jgi:diguanylate cyclase (GGDEF)-like protein